MVGYGVLVSSSATLLPLAIQLLKPHIINVCTSSEIWTNHPDRDTARKMRMETRTHSGRAQYESACDSCRRCLARSCSLHTSNHTHIHASIPVVLQEKARESVWQPCAAKRDCSNTAHHHLQRLSQHRTHRRCLWTPGGSNILQSRTQVRP